jgi:type III secretory pathway component EscS
MDQMTYVQYLMAFTVDAMFLTAVPLGVATVVGLLISIIQAVTQIQDQTIAQTAKIAAISLTLILFGGALVAPLMTSSRQLFDTFATLGH